MPTAPTDERQRVFIGDVHGCADELEQLLDELQYDAARHAIYFCGDIVNRGPRSLDALRLAREVAADAVLGNHDLHLIARAAGLRPEKPRDTLDDVLAAADRAELVAWLQQRPALVTWPDLVLVHAGLRGDWNDLDAVARGIRQSVDWQDDPMLHADLRFATTVRFCDPSGASPPPAIERPALRATRHDAPGPIAAPFGPWDNFVTDPRIVVFGHWAQRGLVRNPRLRGIDTGCVWGGRLTAWLAEEDRFLSVPARRAYQAVP